MQSQANQTGGIAEAFDPLEFDRFTRFQELTRFLAESVNDVATVQQSLLKSLGEADAALLQQARQNRELQQELMHIRMMPLSSIADRLHRIVRQTARELDKKVDLEIKGGRGGTGPKRAGKNDGTVRTSAAQFPGPRRGKCGRQDSGRQAGGRGDPHRGAPGRQ